VVKKMNSMEREERSKGEDWDNSVKKKKMQLRGKQWHIPNNHEVIMAWLQ
jgi:hypothetical protein